MQSKSYTAMRNELDKLYKEKIEKYIPEYEKERKRHAIIHIFFNIIITLILLFIITIFIPFAQDFFTQIAGYIFVALIIAIIIDILVSKYLGFKGNSTTINCFFDDDLKKKYMDEIINIFLKNAHYSKEIYPEEGYKEHLQNTKIFNFIPFILKDDNIKGTYNNVELKINEISTKFVDYTSFIIMVFILLLFGMHTNNPHNIFPFIGLLALPTIILFIPIVLKKFYEYSPFRGLIIELDFKQDLKQETFF